MSKKNEIYAKLKELFNLVTKEKFSDTKLKDGSMLRGDLIAGSKLQLVAADGSVSDVVDGEYEIEDGRKVSIKGGVVDAISDAVAPAVDPSLPSVAPVTDEPMAADPVPAVETPASTAPVSTDAPTEDDVDGMLPSIVADLASRVASLEAALGDAKAANVEMSKVIEKMSKEPGASPIVRTSTAEAFSVNSKEDHFSKIEELANFRKNK